VSRISASRPKKLLQFRALHLTPLIATRSALGAPPHSKHRAKTAPCICPENPTHAISSGAHT